MAWMPIFYRALWHIGRRFQPVDATLYSFWKFGVSLMKYRRRVFFTDKQKSEIWDPSQRCKHRLPGGGWQRGESMRSIGRGFDRSSSSIYPLLARTGGIRPPVRIRSQLALTLAEREEMSRGLIAKVGPVPLSCRSTCSFKLPRVRKRQGFSSPMLSGVHCRQGLTKQDLEKGAGCRSR